MFLQHIQKWNNKYQAYNRALETFWYSLDVYIKDESDEFKSEFPDFSKEKLTLRNIKLTYEVDYPNFQQEFISVIIEIYYEDMQKGWFKQLYTLDGEEFDEYFVID